MCIVKFEGNFFLFFNYFSRVVDDKNRKYFGYVSTTFYTSHSSSQFLSIFFIFANYILAPFLNDFNTIVTVNNSVLYIISFKVLVKNFNEPNKIIIIICYYYVRPQFVCFSIYLHLHVSDTPTSFTILKLTDSVDDLI